MADMKILAHTLGFKLEFTKGFYFPRDHFFSTPTELKRGASESIHSQEDIEKAVQKGASWEVQLELRDRAFTNHICFMGDLGATLKAASKVSNDCFLRGIPNMNGSVAYIEGGNMYTISGLNNRRVVVVGASLKGINLALAHTGAYGKQAKEANSEIMSSLTFTSPEIYHLLKEKFALGYIRIGGKEGFLTHPILVQLIQKTQLQEASRGLQALAISEAVIPPFPFKPTDVLLEHANSVKELEFEHVIVQDLFAKILEVNAEDVYFIPQAAYHLDNFMHPGPKGTMLVQSYEMIQIFLKTVRDDAGDFKLTKKDRGILDRYIKTAEQLQKDLGGLLSEASQKLTDKGITPIPIPAVFYDASIHHSKEPTFHVNFINGLSGFSPKRGKYYYIATGAQVGDKLGAVLMDLFAWHLRQLEPNLEVFYVGRDHQKPDNFSEVMRYWNQPGTTPPQAGLHCLTFPLETEVHEQE